MPLVTISFWVDEETVCCACMYPGRTRCICDDPEAQREAEAKRYFRRRTARTQLLPMDPGREPDLT